MAVLQHEGTHTVIFGAIPIPIGSSVGDGYLARPDSVTQAGTVIVLHGITGLDSTTKQLCRAFARRGFVAVAPDWYRGAGPAGGADLDEAFRSYAATRDGQMLALVDETVEYLASEHIRTAGAARPVVVGFDLGGRLALLYAAHNREVAGVVSLYAPLRGDATRDMAVMDAIPLIGAPTLGLYGADDDLIPVEDVDEAQAATPNGQWILYEGVGHGFLDPSQAGYDPGAEADAIARMMKMAVAACSE